MSACHQRDRLPGNPEPKGTHRPCVEVALDFDRSTVPQGPLRQRAGPTAYLFVCGYRTTRAPPKTNKPGHKSGRQNTNNLYFPRIAFTYISLQSEIIRYMGYFQSVRFGALDKVGLEGSANRTLQAGPPLPFSFVNKNSFDFVHLQKQTRFS